MTLGEMFSLIRLIVNKDFSGNIITPDRFNELIKVVNIDLFRSKYGLPEEYQPGRPIANESIDITLKNTDDMKAFKVFLQDTAVTSGVLPFPTNYAHRNEIVYNYSKVINRVVTIIPKGVEILRESELAARRGNYTKQPSLSNPVGVVRSNGIYIYPATIPAVDFSYYRFPVDPVFAYTLGNGFVTYDAVSSVPFEFPIDEHITLVRLMLSLIGINLREETISNYAELKLQKG
jgi:hypothetical protein